MSIKVFKISFPDIEIERRNTARIRAYIAGRHQNFSELHNHKPDGSSIYRYPVIQYKIIDGKAFIIGYNEGGDILESFMLEEEKLIINGHTLELNEKHITKKIEQFGACENEMSEYKFKNPWFALNTENYQKYMNFNAIEKIKLLEKILIGNIISIAKSFGYTVKSQLECRLMVNPIEIKIKDKIMLGFNGNFQINFKLPNLIGVGKMVSRGFGAVEIVNRK